MAFIIKSVFANKEDDPLANGLLYLTYGSAFHGNKALSGGMDRWSRIYDSRINSNIDRVRQLYFYRWAVRILAVDNYKRNMIKRLQNDAACTIDPGTLCSMYNCEPVGVSLVGGRRFLPCHQSFLDPTDQYRKFYKIAKTLEPYAVEGNVFISTLIWPHQRATSPNQPCIDHVNEAFRRIRVGARWIAAIATPVLRPGFDGVGVALALRVFAIMQVGKTPPDLVLARTHKGTPVWATYEPTIAGVAKMVGNPEHNYPAKLLFSDTSTELLNAVHELQGKIRQRSYGFSKSTTSFEKTEVLDERSSHSRRLALEVTDLEHQAVDPKGLVCGVGTNSPILHTATKTIDIVGRRLRLEPTHADGRPSSED